MSTDSKAKDMWDRFDAVAVLRTTAYPSRQEGLLKELDRVGLIDRVEWFWDFDNPFMVRLANSLRLSRDVVSIAGFRRTMNHYRVVKTLSELGYKRSLVLEDDVRFLNDIDTLAAGVKALPDDYDLAKFEWAGRPARGSASLPEIKSPWHRLSEFDADGCAAVAYSDAGMRWRAAKLEECADYSSLFTELHMVDAYDNQRSFGGLKVYVANPLLAVQDFVEGGVHGPHPVTYKMYSAYLPEGGMGAYAVSR